MARAAGAVAALSMGTFLYVTSETMPIGLLLPMAEDLGVSASAVGWLVTGYAAVVVVASVPLTLLTGRVPRRALLCGLLAVFVVTAVVPALAGNYGVVFGARVVSALSQALFWAVVIPTAAGLVRPAMRGRAVSVVVAGASVAVVLGVPAGAWFGEVAGWRAAFLALAGTGLVVLAAVALLLPAGSDRHRPAARGSTPDALRYGLLIAVATLASTGAFVAYTYVAPFLTEVGGFTAAAVGPLLFVRGVASVAGVAAAGIAVDRRPAVTVAAGIAVQAVAMFGLFVLGDNRLAVVGLVALTGLAFASFTAAMGARVLDLAPGRPDLAAAGISTAINVGITAGALLGGLLLPGFGVRSTVLVGGILSVVAVAAATLEPRLNRRSRQRSSVDRPSVACG